MVGSEVQVRGGIACSLETSTIAQAVSNVSAANALVNCRACASTAGWVALSTASRCLVESPVANTAVAVVESIGTAPNTSTINKEITRGADTLVSIPPSICRAGNTVAVVQIGPTWADTAESIPDRVDGALQASSI